MGIKKNHVNLHRFLNNEAFFISYRQVFFVVEEGFFATGTGWGIYESNIERVNNSWL